MLCHYVHEDGKNAARLALFLLFHKRSTDVHCRWRHSTLFSNAATVARQPKPQSK